MKVRVIAVNDAPVANSDIATTAKNVPIVINVKANDTDVEGNRSAALVVSGPANGKVVAHADGSFTYTPKTDFTGTDTFTYRLNDGANSNPATVTITVTPTNAAPTAVKDSVTTKEDTAVTIKVLANDKDADGDALSASVVAGPANGAVTANSDGSLAYTPNANFNGTDTFTYSASDGSLASAPATVTVKVTPVKDIPVAQPDNATTTANVPVRIDVTANDVNPDGAALTPTVVTNPAHGTVARTADGSFTYTPAANFTGTDTFTYRLNGGGATSAPATVTISVNPTNHAPVAGNDTATVAEGGTTTVSVLGNDTDPDGNATIDPATVAVTQAAHGTVTANTDGTVTYTSNGDEVTSDSFTYTVKDSSGAVSNSATVSVTVAPVNDGPPVAGNDTATVAEGGTTTVSVLGNDTDPDGNATIDPASLQVTQPAHGTVTANTDGTVTYTSNGDEVTSDSFTYTVKDSSGATSNVATVNVTIAPVNDGPPVATNDAVIVNEGGTAKVSVSGNDTDPDGNATIDPATVVLTQPAHGSASVDAAGVVTYTSNGDEVTSDSFTYTVKDSSGATSNVATVNVTIAPVNDGPPVAANDAVAVAEGGTAKVSVLGNDTDPDGNATIDPATVVLTQPAHGSASVDAAGVVTYTSNGDEVTSDSFTYTVKDSSGATSNVATVNVTITAVNDGPPVAANDAVAVAEGGTTTVSVLGNDTDPDGNATIDPTTVVLTQPVHGSASVDAASVVTYTSNGDEVTSDSFTYTVKDSSGAVSNTATVTVTITPVNDGPPVAANDAVTVNEGGTTTVSVLGNDTDPDGNATIDPASLQVTQPAHGTVTANTDGTVTYTSNGDEVTSDSFTYIVNDSSGAVSNTATVTVTITPVNDGAPLASSDAVTVVEGGTTTVSVLGNDTDPDGNATIDPASLQVTQPAHGTVTANTDGTVTYTSNGDEVTSDSFTYTVKDSSGATSNVATVNVTITPVNDGPPMANNDAVTVNQGGTTTLSVLTNDTDPDGNATINPATVIVTQPAHGTVTANTDGTVTYASNGDEVASDSFTYTVTDSSGAVSNTATVTVTITPVNTNHAPVAVNDTVSGDEDAAITGNVLTGDTDADDDILTATLVSNPAHGALVLNSDGSFTYTPAANFNGTDTFTYRANDGISDSNTATVAITVNAVDDAPTANSEQFTIAEDTGLTGNVLANDTDPDGDVLTAALVSRTGQGALSFNSDGSFTYTPAANFNGTETINYSVSDGATTSFASLKIEVTPVNDAPAAVDDTYTTPNNVAVTGNLLANDSDADGDALIASVATGPAHGALVLNADGSFTYTAAANFTGADNFTYRVSDGSTTDTALVTVVVTAPVPLAGNDAVTTAEDTPVVINVLANDTDPQGDKLTPKIVTPPARGGLTLNADGSFTYTPEVNFNGADTFTYTAGDSSTTSAPATVTITVTPVDDPGKAPLVLGGELDSVQYSLDGSRAFVISEKRESEFGGVVSTTVSIVNTATGAAVGSPVTVSGGESSSVTFNPSSPRAGLVFGTSDGQGNVTTTLLTVNTTTGAVVRAVVLDGRLDPDVPQALTYSPDGARATFVTTSGPFDGSITPTSIVTIVDTVTGAAVGGVPLTFQGDLDAVLYRPDALNPRVLVAYTEFSGAEKVAVLNTATGNTVTVVPVGGEFFPFGDGIGLSANNSRAVVITAAGNPNQNQPTTAVTTFNVTSGSQVSVVVVQGAPRVVQYTSDRALAFVVSEIGSQSNPASISSSLAIVDTSTGSVLPRFPFAGRIDSLVSNASRAVLTYTDSDDVSHVAVVNTTTGAQVGLTVNLTAHPTGAPIMTTDGAHAVIIATDQTNTTITNIELSKGGVVGTPLVLGGELDSVQYSLDGSRAFVISEKRDAEFGGVVSTTVSIVNTATGAAVGSPVTVSGESSSVTFNPSSPRAGLVFGTSDGQGNVTTTLLTVNTTTGAVVRAVVLDGRLDPDVPQALTYSPDGARAIFVTTSDPFDGSITPTSIVTIVDTVTGAAVGGVPLTFQGDLDAVLYRPDALNPRVLVAYTEFSGAEKVAVLNTATGNTVTVVPVGGEFFPFGDGIGLSANNSRAVVITAAGNPNQNQPTTAVTTFNVTSGSQVSVVVVQGAPRVVQYTSDRALAFVVSEIGSQSNPASISSSLAIVDTSTGSVLPRFPFAGRIDSLVSNASRAVLTYTDSDDVSHVAVVNTTTGAQVGLTVNLTAHPTGAPIMTTDGAHAVIIATDQTNTTITNIELSKGGVVPYNDAPAAVDDQFVIANDSVLFGNVQTNDIDVDGDTLTPTVLSSPAHGAVVINAHGSFSYTPDAGFVGADTFTYRVGDGTSNSRSATVTITVGAHGF